MTKFFSFLVILAAFFAAVFYLAPYAAFDVRAVALFLAERGLPCFTLGLIVSVAYLMGQALFDPWDYIKR